MNSLLTLLGIESWKPVMTALVLPPVPFLLLLLVGARLMLPRRGLGWTFIVLSVVGLWLSACVGMGQLLSHVVLKSPAPLSRDSMAELKSAAQAKQPVALVVLGAGSEPLAPEYGVSNLVPSSVERLRYALWLSRETGIPVAFSGGVSWGQPERTPEALIASRIAAKEFGQPLKWLEDRSRDTRENAMRTVPLLKQEGITRIVLVTHGWHMPRALKMFETVAAGSVKIDAAPMGLAEPKGNRVMDWLPTARGYAQVQHALREMLALLVRA